MKKLQHQTHTQTRKDTHINDHLTMLGQTQLTLSNDSIQIVGEDQVFNKDILSYIKSITSKDIGFNYHIISVFGSQSTGKSTLLNTLFGTKFDVMNEAKRQQTTKGIWLAYASQIASHQQNITNQSNDDNDDSTTAADNFKPNNDKNILVMDVEGTDGRERGEDQDFERKAALFALSTSEILIINIWEHQVGLYQGANMALLKTVFEVNLSLFANSNPKKCLLLFVIRDHVGTTSLDSLADVLTEDLNRIWGQLNKPNNLKDSKLSDYFDLGFTSLPHKLLRPEEFIDDVGKLGDRFIGEDTYFKSKYHKQVPFDGWTVYSENIWDQIVQNKELDLPTQQILVSRFRCDEIVNGSYEIFESNFKKLLPNFDGKSLPKQAEGFDISKIFLSLKKEPLENYDQLASRYTKSVYLDKRNQLIEKIDLHLTTVYKIHLTDLKKSALSLFNSKVTTLKKAGKISFDKIIETALSESLQYFKDNLVSSETTPSDGDNKIQTNESKAFKSEIEYDDLEKSLYEAAEIQRQKELKALVLRFFKKFNPQLKEKIIYLLNSPNDKTWDEALFVFQDLLEKGLKQFKSSEADQFDFGLGLSAKKNKHLLLKIKRNSWKSFHTIIHDYLSEDNVVKIMREKFEDKFRYDEEGLPHVWKNSAQIDISFKNAKQDALTILPILSLAKTSDNLEIIPELPTPVAGEDDEEEEEEDDESDFDQQSFSHILSDIQQNNVSNKFKKQVDVLYIEAKRSTIQSITAIPYWIYIIIVVLGWNEFMAIIKNPLYFSFLAILLVSAYFIHQLNLWGPVRIVVENTVNETVKVTKSKLKEILVDEDDYFLSNKTTRTSDEKSSSDEKVTESILLQDLDEKKL